MDLIHSVVFLRINLLFFKDIEINKEYDNRNRRTPISNVLNDKPSRNAIVSLASFIKYILILSNNDALSSSSTPLAGPESSE